MSELHLSAAGAGTASPQLASPAAQSGRAARAAAAISDARKSAPFRRITLPDLLVVVPRGLTPVQLQELHRLPGFRSLITFSGARIQVAGRAANAISVSPAQFRSWVPLRTASDQAFWAALRRGDMVSSVAAAASLRLRRGDRYPLRGATTQQVTFGGSAQLGVAGVDLLVSPGAAGHLGLIQNVAALISAPGAQLAELVKSAQQTLGPAARVVSLRTSQQSSATASDSGGQPASYLQLFRESAARYCPQLSWTVLAAIGQIESADGTNVGPSTAGALGPMQFEPSTWAVWGTDGFGQTGTPNIMNPYDAVPSAARMLCADGASAGPAGLRAAVFAYNHAQWYVNEVLALASEYGATYR